MKHYIITGDPKTERCQKAIASMPGSGVECVTYDKTAPWPLRGFTRMVNELLQKHPDEKPQIRSIPDLWPPLAQDGLNPVIDIEDLSMMQMQLDNGVFASYQQCHYTPDAWRNYTVIGTEGRIENFGDFTGDVIVRLWNKPPNYNPDGDEQFRVSNGPAAEHGGADPRIVGEFVRLLREDGAAASATPIEARDSVAAGYAATESLRHGGIPMDVPTYQPSNSTPR